MRAAFACNAHIAFRVRACVRECAGVFGICYFAPPGGTGGGASERAESLSLRYYRRRVIRALYNPPLGFPRNRRLPATFVLIYITFFLTPLLFLVVVVVVVVVVLLLFPLILLPPSKTLPVNVILVVVMNYLPELQ